MSASRQGLGVLLVLLLQLMVLLPLLLLLGCPASSGAELWPEEEGVLASAHDSIVRGRGGRGGVRLRLCPWGGNVVGRGVAWWASGSVGAVVGPACRG